MGREKKICGKKCEKYSRVVGYYRNVNNFNVGKKKEFEERKTFSLDKVDEKDEKN